MHPNEKLIETFYTAFQNKDPAAMIACYHPEVEFCDPVFTGLKGDRAGAMWEMLARRAKDLTLTFGGIFADDQRGRAHWEATYTFSETGRKVHNVIDAEFSFRDGKIVRHQDRFNLWRWAAMALGLQGMLMGWLPPVQSAIRKKAAGNLDRYLSSRDKPAQ